VNIHWCEHTGLKTDMAEETLALADAELRHGYMLDDLTRLARWVARSKLYEQRSSFAFRYDIAWYGIVEHLYASEERPTVGELSRAGWVAIRREGDARDRFLGYDRYAGNVWRGFERF
jgi:hypothetical protein